MFPTAFTHGITQFARTFSLPERIQRSPVRNLALEGLRRRNTTLDAVFYDVKSVTAEEAFYISGCLAAEGAILIVPPTGGPPLKLCDTVDDFIVHGGRSIDTLVVAGVGSSALGSAAFARNVADATGRPVAAVVSGYGLADVVTEALGGYFLFGTLNGVRHQFEMLDEFFGRPQFGIATHLSAERLQERSLDTQTVRALLDEPRLSFSLLVGHSKGSLVLSEALYGLAEEDRARAERLAEGIRIITISARIAMPPLFRNVIDVMGEWDWFGEINSRRVIKADEVVPHALHHTNTELPNHVPVTSVVERILARTATDGGAMDTAASAPADSSPEPDFAQPEAVQPEHVEPEAAQPAPIPLSASSADTGPAEMLSTSAEAGTPPAGETVSASQQTADAASEALEASETSEADAVPLAVQQPDTMTAVLTLPASAPAATAPLSARRSSRKRKP